MNHINLSRPRVVALAVLALAVVGGGLAGVTALQASDQPAAADRPKPAIECIAMVAPLKRGSALALMPEVREPESAGTVNA